MLTVKDQLSFRSNWRISWVVWLAALLSTAYRLVLHLVLGQLSRAAKSVLATVDSAAVVFFSMVFKLLDVPSKVLA